MTRRYFIHGLNIAAVEDAEQAERFVTAGWVEVTEDRFMTAWRERDEAWMDQAVEAAAAAFQKLSYAERVKRGI